MKNYQNIRPAQFKQGIAPIIIALIVAVLVGGGYAVVKTNPGIAKKLGMEGQIEKKESAETANWKTYTSSVRGFSMKYPPQWYVSDDSRASYVNFLSQQSTNDSEKLKGTKIQVSTYSKSKSESLQSLVSRPNELTGTAPKVEAVTVAGIQGFKNNYVGDGVYYLPTSEAGGFTIMLFSNSETSKDSLEISRQILETIKFISPTSATTTSDWKTYTNEKYGFEVKYPPVLESPRCGGEGGGCVFAATDTQVTDYYIVVEAAGYRQNPYSKKGGPLGVTPSFLKTINGRQIFWKYDGTGDPQKNLQAMGFTCDASWDCEKTPQYHAYVVVPTSNSLEEADNVVNVRFSGMDIRDKERYKEIFTNFLSTFKFIK